MERAHKKKKKQEQDAESASTAAPAKSRQKCKTAPRKRRKKTDSPKATGSSTPRRALRLPGPNEIPTFGGPVAFGVDLVTKRMGATVRLYKGVTHLIRSCPILRL